MESPAEPVELDLGMRFNDFVAALITAPLAVVLLTTWPSLHYDWPGFMQYTPQQEAILSLFGTLLGLFVAWMCAMHILRLIAGPPDIVIDETGFAFRPAFGLRFVPWTAVAGSRFSQQTSRGRTYYTLELELTHALRTITTAFWPRKKLSFASTHRRAMQEAARSVRAYRLTAGWKR